jgi:hypothetical protein
MFLSPRRAHPQKEWNNDATGAARWAGGVTTQSPAEPIQAARVPACSSEASPRLITAALTGYRSFCVYTVRQVSLNCQKKEKENH